MFNRISATVKSAARSTIAGVKKYFVPVAYTVGQLFKSATGGILFTQKLADRLYQYYTNQPGVPAPPHIKIPLVLFLFSSTIVFGSLTRFLPLLRAYINPNTIYKLTPEPLGERINELTNEYIDGDSQEYRDFYNYWTQATLGIGWNALLIYIRTELYSQMASSLNDSVFGMIKFFEFIAELYGGASLKLSDIVIVLQVAFTLYGTYSTAQFFRAFMIPRVMKDNINQINGGEGSITASKKLIIIIPLTLISGVFAASNKTFQTISSIEKYKELSPFLNNLISKEMEAIITVNFAKSAFVFELVSTSHTINRTLDKFIKYVETKRSPQVRDIELGIEFGKEEKVPLPRYWKIMKIPANVTAVTEAFSFGSGALTSIPFAIGEATSIDPNSNGLSFFVYPMAIILTGKFLATNIDYVNYSEGIVLEFAEGTAYENKQKAKKTITADSSDDESIPLQEIISSSSPLSVYDPSGSTYAYGTFPDQDSEKPDIVIDMDTDEDIVLSDNESVPLQETKSSTKGFDIYDPQAPISSSNIQNSLKLFGKSGTVNNKPTNKYETLNKFLASSNSKSDSDSSSDSAKAAAAEYIEKVEFKGF